MGDKLSKRRGREDEKGKGPGVTKAAVAGASKKKKKKIIGWREWVRLPDLRIDRIKAKIDTGARTSALHAHKITPFTKDGAAYVRFAVHPIQRQRKPEVVCVALVIDERAVTPSGGRSERRYVIRTLMKLGKSRWPVELTLTNRDHMGFRMLIGRQALRRRYLVDPGRSFVVRKKKKRRKRRLRAR
jgi:hypothetical protein